MTTLTVTFLRTHLGPVVRMARHAARTRWGRGAAAVTLAAATAASLPAALAEDAPAGDEPVEALAAGAPVEADLHLLRRAEPPAPEPTPAPEPPAPTTTAPPAPAPAPAPAGSPSDVIAAIFGPHASAAIAVARCESTLNPAAMSAGGGNHGLFQINNVHSGRFEAVTGRPWSDRYDAVANTTYAKWLFDRSGWGPWSCKRVL